MSGKTHTASYNSQNQLTKYDDVWYTYDADGNRVSAGDSIYHDHQTYRCYKCGAVLDRDENAVQNIINFKVAG